MAGMDWNEGYAVDHAYISEFYPNLSPQHLNCSCILNGVEPIPLDQPFTYFELGFGQGLNLVLLASTYPHAKFYGNDFMPVHVAAAEQLAASAQLENVTLLENSFLELAQGNVALPQFDFITLHGVYSWVSVENRKYVVDFLARYLKPGGIVYISYNALPGWAVAMPLQRLISPASGLYSGNSMQQLESAKQLIQSLVDADAGYFAKNPALQFWLNKIKNDNPVYAVHEYVNHEWHPLYHAEVVAELSSAKLDFVGTPIVSTAWHQLSSAQQQIVDAISDPAWRVGMMDFMLNTLLRRDIFVRGRRALPAARKLQLSRQCVLALTVPRDIAVIFGYEENQFAHEVLDALAQAPRSFHELAEFALFDGDIEAVAVVAANLCFFQRAVVFRPVDMDIDTRPALRLNRVIAERSCFENQYQTLASPLLGNGVNANLILRLVYSQLTCSQLTPGVEHDAPAMALRIFQILKDQAELNTEESTDTPEPNLTEITAQVERVLTHYLPLWKQLKAI
jgi:SAM-dependent methyltransferase